jgi:hypothetical protein
MRPHAIIHRWYEEHRRIGGEQYRRQQVIGTAYRGPGKKIGRGRRHDDRVGRTGQLDVVERVAGGEKVGRDGSTGDGLERDGADEVLRRPRLDDIDLGAGLRQPTREGNGLIARDAPSDAEQYPALREWPHGGAAPDGER